MSDKGPSIPRQLIASPLAQALLFILTVVYVIFPVDVIPDVLPVIGWLDDLAVFITQVTAFVMYLQEKRRQFAAKQQQGQGEGSNNGR